METFPTKALDQFPCPTWPIVSGFSFKEERGKQLVRADHRSRVEKVNTETIRSGSLHRHDLTLQNSRRPYVCSGCKEDGIGERFRCVRPECGRQYHKFCAQPEDNRNHRYFSGCCFNLVRDGGRHRGDRPYCAACSKDIKGFFYSCSHGGQVKNLHPWCMHMEPSKRVKSIMMLLVPRMNNKCIECGCRTLMRNCRDQRGNVVPRKMETWGYAREDGQGIIHIHCMKKRVGQYWRSMMTKDDLISRNPFPDDNSSGFLMELVKYMLEFFFRLGIGIPLTLTPPS